MINNNELPGRLTRSQQLDPYLATHAAHLRIADLRAEAESAQLAREYRRAHPELRPRYRAATVLRRLADRIAPPPTDINPRPKVVRL